MNKILIKYQLNTNETTEAYKELTDILEDVYKNHVKVMRTMYFIKTTDKPTDVSSFLKDFIDEDDFIWCDYISSNPGYRIPSKAAEWLRNN